MVLVEALSTVHTAQDLNGDEVLHNATERLKDNDDVGDETQHAVRGSEASMVAFVDFDDDEGGDEGEQADGLDDVMDDSSQALLVRGSGGL